MTMMPISVRALAALVVAGCLAALAFALVVQYGFGLRPCVLCLTERAPFAIAAVLALSALWGARGGRGGERPLFLLGLAGIVLAVNAGLAVYHVGVEHHWWASAVCGGEPAAGALSIGDLTAALSHPAEVRCDTPAWEWHGVTLATLNIFYSAVFAAVVLAGCRCLRRTRG